MAGRLISLGALLALLAHPALAEDAGRTQAAVQERGYLICGVGVDDIGFATQTVNGNWVGFEVDLCRGVAAAVLEDANAVEFVPLDSLNRLNVLAEGGVDVLFRTTTYNFARDVMRGFEFPAITYYDVQRVLVFADTGATRLRDLDGRTICANSGTTSIDNIRAAIARAGIDTDVLEIASQSGRWRAFFGRECDAVTADGSDLAARIASQPQYRDDFVFLEEEISNEPLGAVVRDDDTKWTQIIRWVVNLTIVAEAADVGQSSDAASLASLHIPGGAGLGLKDGWGASVIRQVGHYGEIFDRNLGAGSDLKLPRGLNRLWKDGGLMYPLPMGHP
ncbi:transporter substrate-binding domain-containing protein [Nitratireductor pacificus]|uniref:Amino acid ABC transporter substrate-binding protein n=1 Tax=Nitratireductor pacificus pht-3B TaxID=391937 RepID=K2MDD6_9HYPH|nr:transporter substrate-binding domain-containing protein [Nitratireductor pacificus]EKF20176.1 amino acid ABC transporter substrate-binding protein [Nitratireductor pacificus pht-3B]